MITGNALTRRSVGFTAINDVSFTRQSWPHDRFPRHAPAPGHRNRPVVLHLSHEMEFVADDLMVIGNGQIVAFDPSTGDAMRRGALWAPSTPQE